MTLYKYVQGPPAHEVGPEEVVDDDVYTSFRYAALLRRHPLVGFGEQPQMSARQNALDQWP